MAGADVEGNGAPPPSQAVKTWLCVDVPSMDYADAWDLQKRLVDARRPGTLPSDVLLLLEHPPVFTLGRRGGFEQPDGPRELS